MKSGPCCEGRPHVICVYTAHCLMLSVSCCHCRNAEQLCGEGGGRNATAVGSRGANPRGAVYVSTAVVCVGMWCLHVVPCVCT